MAHSHHHHREHQVSHRRVHHILKDEPGGAKEHAKRHAFSKVTSKTGAEDHDAFVAGAKTMKRYARGGKVKGKGHQTNIAIVMPHHPAAGGAPAGPIPGPGGPPPMAGPGGPPMMAKPPMAPPPGGPPGAPPPGMPMRKHGGRVKKDDGGSVQSSVQSNDDAEFQRMNQAAAAQRNRQAPAVSAGVRPNPNASYDPRTGKATGFKHGGRVHKAGGGGMDGKSTRADIKKWSKEASKNSYASGGFVKPTVKDGAGAMSGEGRLEKAAWKRKN